jgi:iron complex transport system substrate-binding protein
MKNKCLTVVPIFAFTALLFCFTACNKAPAENTAVRTLTDPMGNTVKISGPIERVFSAAPSNTEIIIALGEGNLLAAVDKYSVDVEGVDRNLPAIDFMYPDAEAIIALHPDLIIASEHNMVAGDDPFKLIRESGIAVAYMPSSGGIAEIYRDIAFIADLLGVSERGEEIIRDMQESIEGIAVTGSSITERKTVYFEISPSPYIVSFGSGTFLHEMLEIIGAENIFAGTTGWIAAGEEAIVAANPEVILTNSGSFDGGDPVAEILGRPGFRDIRAVRNRAVYRIDSNASSRPTHHIVKALLEMARAVYPEY